MGGARLVVVHGIDAQPLRAPAAPRPPSRTKWTRRVPHPVLIGHAASLSQVRYVSDSLCVFEFELTGTNIVAVKKA